MARIAVLSADLINKIAAGEVVERPASVVKELCENSLDAGARTVRVVLEGGGLGRIRITDDGMGMSREDALLALERHATSKLRDLEGLFSITTLGFRGEAVPAIASVSRFELTTAEPGSAVGTRIEIEGGRLVTVEEAPPLPGTTLQVDDLFFNTPARRKFMRREATELSHCEESVLRLALAHPEVGFFLEQGGRSILSSPPCGNDLRDRIAHVFGAEVHSHLRPLEERRLGITVRGVLALPTFTFPTARGIYTFVNGRFIRDRGLNGAIGRAYGEFLPPGRQPVVILFIEVDPSAVDVNVHPQKLEVRFSDGRGVYDAVHAALGRGVRVGMGPSVSALVGSATGDGPPGGEAHYAHAVERFLSQARDAGLSASGMVAGGAAGPVMLAGGASYEPASWQGMGGFPQSATATLPLPEAAESSPFPGPPGARPAFGQARPELNEAPPPGYFEQLRFMGSLGRRFWVCEGRGGSLVVLDPHAAVERLRLCALLERWEEGESSPQARGPSLFSSVVSLTPVLAQLAEALKPVLHRLGLYTEPFGGDSVLLAAVPPGFEQVAWERVLPEVLACLQAKGAPPMEAIRRLACAAAEVGVSADPSHDELTRLFASLEQADFSARATHGSVMLSELLWLDLERRASAPGRGRPEN